MDIKQEAVIARRASDCLGTFRRLLQARRERDQEFWLNDIPEDAIIDALARFRTWIENIGALQGGEASLDYRLRHVDIRVEVVRLLDQLLLSLDDLWQILSGARTQQSWTTSDVTDFLDDSDNQGSDQDDSGERPGTPSSPSEFSGSTTESQLLYQSILESITSLLKLSMFIRKSAGGNKFGKSSTTQKYETQYDISHVRDKFPFASKHSFLMERLGKANAQRRQWLSYKKRHREKLAMTASPKTETSPMRRTFKSLGTDIRSRATTDFDHPEFSILTGEHKESPTTLSSTKASTFYHREDLERNALENELSETSYSETRFGDDREETNLVPQPPPISAGGNPFECPYCFSIIVISGMQSWTKHVHTDLASYVCTQDHCTHPLFESRNQWFNHELEEHRRQWVCDICDTSLHSVQSFKAHLTENHSGAFLESQMTALAARSARPLRRINASACPLCDYEAIVRGRLGLHATTEPTTVSIRTFRNHLGRHLEQLALFVLPKEEVVEQAGDAVRTQGGNAGELELSSEGVYTDDSDAIDSVPEAEENTSNSRPDLPGDKSTRIGAEVREMTSGITLSLLDKNQTTGVLGTDDVLEESASAPDLAFIWMPPMDFTPPEADFEVDDNDLVPRREEPMFGGDIFTPGWVRGYGKNKEGFCGRCNPGVWHNIEDSSYENNLTYMHGIASSGLSLPRPSRIRRLEGNWGAWQAYCETCCGWRGLKKSLVGWNWFRHCVKEHGSPGANQSPKHLHLSNASLAHQEIEDLERLNNNIRMNDMSNFESSLTWQPTLALAKDVLGRTPLHYAAELGHVSSMQHLLRICEDHRDKADTRSFIDARASNGETALMLAAAQGHKEAAEWLLIHLADVNATAINGYTALDDAAEAGFSELAKLLITHKADTRKAKLFHQVRSRNIAQRHAKASSRLDYTNPLDIKSDLSNTTNTSSLRNAILQSNLQAIQTILANGADVEEFSKDGQTPLMLAASRCLYAVIDVLASSGVNINATSAKGWTALMYAVRKKDERTVEHLISHGADVNHLSPDRWTVLAEAAYQGQKTIMKRLLEYGADTESRSSHDWTPLMHATYKGDIAAVRLLLDAGADMEVTSGHDETAVLLAAAGGYTNIARLLLDAGCRPEPVWAKMPDDGSTKGVEQPKSKATTEAEERAYTQGWTPLMLASQGGHEEIAVMLLHLGVNIEARSPHAKTALEIARENGRSNMARMLEQADMEPKCAAK